MPVIHKDYSKQKMIYFGTNQSEIDQIQELDNKASRTFNTLKTPISIFLPDNLLLPANTGSDRSENRNKHPCLPLK